ncbi:MAG: hypothetical protein GY832_20065 [Chloroflexi bacterium]|nr:hypothetical protein [Chloroflexota bacterium]
MRTEPPVVSLKTDPEQNRVVRDGKGLQVSRLALHQNGDGTVELDIRTVSGCVPVTLIITSAILTELATQWLRILPTRRLLAKWQKAQKIIARGNGNGRCTDPQLQPEKAA